MCPAAAGGGASSKNHAFCSKQRWTGQDARIQRLNKCMEDLLNVLVLLEFID
jgi:hypothetical protein